MKRVCVVLSAVLMAGVAGWASAQNLTGKARNGPALKAQPKKAGSIQKTYGTDFSSFHRMGANEFTGVNVTGFDDWTDAWYSDVSVFRRFPQVADGWFIGTPHLPSGAQLLAVHIENCVNTGGAPGTFSGGIYGCNPDGDGCTLLAAINTVTGCGYDSIDLSGSGWVVDNHPDGNYLVIQIEMTNTDGTDALAGASIEYRLQVSPAPAIPTFTDVPDTDFGYQFIEALVASGITGGTGGGLYSPNAFVTRRQMAIFIAKALGLQFP